MRDKKDTHLPDDLDVRRLKLALSSIHQTINQIPNLDKVAAGLAIAVRELDKAEARSRRGLSERLHWGPSNRTRH